MSSIDSNHGVWYNKDVGGSETPLHQPTERREYKMKTITFNKLDLVKVPVEHQAEEGCVAFQLVEYVIDYFGTKVEGRFDTKIGFDGVQRVCGGDGFFEDGKVVA